MRRMLLLVSIVLPAYAAAAGKLDLTQDLSGLDLDVAMVPSESSPTAIKITNKTTKTVSCAGNFTGADVQGPRTVTIKPGKSATVRVPGSYTETPRTAELKCAEKQAAKK